MSAPKRNTMRNTTVLIIEDELIFATLIAEVLIEHDYEVSGIVNSAEKAIEFFKEKSVDIILTDINLRGKITGLEMASLLYKEYSVPIIFLSGSQEQESKIQVEDIKQSRFLLKPFHFKELLDLLEDMTSIAPSSKS